MKHSPTSNSCSVTGTTTNWITNVGQDLHNLSQTVEEFVTEQTLDTDSELVSSDQTINPDSQSRPSWKPVP